MDLIKLSLCVGYGSCLIIIDQYTRWPQAVLVLDTTALTSQVRFSIIRSLLLERLCTSQLVANLRLTVSWERNMPI